MKIWPWSEIARLKRQLQDKESNAERMHRYAEMYRAEYLKLSNAMRGAHKGIWRLKQKLKRLERKEQS